MTMCFIKPLMAVLLAWTFSLQAMAGVMACRHAAGSQPSEIKAVGHASMHHDHAAMMAQQDEHAGHAMAESADSSAKKPEGASGCGCGCKCAKVGCSSSAPGLAITLSLASLDFPVGSLRATMAPVAPSSAYILDLIRPPSMS